MNRRLRLANHYAQLSRLRKPLGSDGAPAPFRANCQIDFRRLYNIGEMQPFYQLNGRGTVVTLVGLSLISTVWAQSPETIYYNAHVITMASDRPAAQAVAIRSDRFTAIGSNDEVLKTAGPQTRKIDLEGKCIVPGIVESHVHPIGAALSEIDGPVPVLRSIPEIQKYIRDQAAKLPSSRLIFVPKVYSTRLVERRYPTRLELDSAAPSREVMLDNGYASVLNSALLRKAV